MRGFLRPFKATQKLIRPRWEIVARGKRGAPGGGGGELPLGALDQLEQADDPAAVRGQEGGAAVGIEEKLLEGLQSQVQGSIVGFMKPEQAKANAAGNTPGAG